MGNIILPKENTDNHTQGNTSAPDLHLSAKWRRPCFRHVHIALNSLSRQTFCICTKLFVFALIFFLMTIPVSEQAAFAKSRDIENTFTHYLTELKKNPANSEALSALINACMNARGSFNSASYNAIDALEQAAEIVPNPISIYNLLANFYTSTDQAQKARNMRKRIHELSKQNLEMAPIFSFTSKLDDFRGRGKSKPYHHRR